MKTNVLGVQYDNVTMAEALDTARALLQRPEASYCVTLPKWPMRPCMTSRSARS